MPLYELVCESCGKKTEQFTHNIKEQRLEICPDCKGALYQQFGSPALFWGKGWGSAPFCFRRKFAYPHSDGKLP